MEGQKNYIISTIKDIAVKIPAEKLDALREEMVWVDDGKAEVTSTITLNKTPIARVTVDYSTPEQ